MQIDACRYYRVPLVLANFRKCGFTADSLDESRFNRVLIPNRIRFEKVRFQGVKGGSETKKNENFQYASGSLPKILVFTVYTECIHTVH